MLKILKSIISAITLFAASHAQAQESPIKLEVDVKAVVETIDKNGQSRVELAEPGTIVPGDRILFGTNYTNTGAEPAENFTMTNPLPGQVRLAPDADPELIVSVDAGTTWGRLTELLVSEEDGTTRPARHGDVTHTGVSATDADGCDQNITDFRILPSGQLNVGAGFTLQTSYPVR